MTTESHVPTSSFDTRSPLSWYKWLREQEELKVEEYRRNPRRLIADYRQESSITRDYAGREILELLQNANDAAAEVGRPGRVRIQLAWLAQDHRAVGWKVPDPTVLSLPRVRQGRWDYDIGILQDPLSDRRGR